MEELSDVWSKIERLKTEYERVMNETESVRAARQKIENQVEMIQKSLVEEEKNYSDWVQTLRNFEQELKEESISKSLLKEELQRLKAENEKLQKEKEEQDKLLNTTRSNFYLWMDQHIISNQNGYFTPDKIKKDKIEQKETTSSKLNIQINETLQAIDQITLQKIKQIKQQNDILLDIQSKKYQSLFEIDSKCNEQILNLSELQEEINQTKK
eukprot:TRINITY_DN2985_c0_g1_i1.p1 TRINITY_DN2985_c0_g1~~TRINITY_DN2985_c0_g1_i1.p1  ORF type:complete len:212 (-),score=75.68 TRINITY_DN2985_c0_g1_i1:45-680(-)